MALTIYYVYTQTHSSFNAKTIATIRLRKWSYNDRPTLVQGMKRREREFL